jgi:hypothetical protein
MRKQLRLLLLIVGACCLISNVSAAGINAAVEYATTGSETDLRPFTLGYEFTTSTNLTINALGYWVDGMGNAHGVGIWDTSGNLLVSTTVQTTDPVVGHFQWGSIANYSLSAGTYVIGGEFLGNDDPFAYEAQGVTSIPGYTWVTDLWSLGSGLNFPTVGSGGTYGDNGIFVADFSVGSSAIPEPATCLLIAPVLLGLGALRRKFRS